MDFGESRMGPKSTRTRKKSLQQRALTVEEVFGSVSDVQASGLNPPPARTVLTPRSAEACLKHGVNPEILRIRDLESFNEAGLDPAIQRMRSEAYSQRRYAYLVPVTHTGKRRGEKGGSKVGRGRWGLNPY